jgi:ketosteroid isomerase-like protein
MGPNAAPLVGRAAIEAFWTENAKRGNWQLTLATQDVVASGNLAVERGTYTLSFTPGPGAPTGMGAFSDRGNYVVQWRRENDQWLIVNDLATSEVPLPPPAQ